MKLLLDTHSFIWWHDMPDNLSEKAYSACLNEANVLFFSIASTWEMQIKINLGKLSLTKPLEDAIRYEQEQNELQLFPILFSHVLAHKNLPKLHRDPFDRMLVAQCLADNLPLVTADPILHQYPISTIW